MTILNKMILRSTTYAVRDIRMNEGESAEQGAVVVAASEL